VNTYVINRDDRPARWKDVQLELNRAGITVFERFSAFPTKPGWHGCRMSHMAIMRLCEDKATFCIFEDDVIFLDDVILLIELAMAQLPSNWSCLYLGASPQKPQQRYSENLFKLNDALCAHAIIWNNCIPNGAVEYILNNEADIIKWDDYLAKVIQPQFNCFVTYPMVATQRADYQSDTCHRSDTTTILRNYNLFCHD
jgi:GR25 family glycosyltransferase involved in LPS biosynthesis